MTETTTPTRSFRIVRTSDDSGHWMQDCRMTVLATADDTAGQVGVLHVVAPPGHQPPLHVHHDEDEAYFVLAGSISIRCGDERGDAGPGTWVYLPRGVAHHFAVTGNDPAQFLLIELPGGFESFFTGQFRPADAAGLPVAPEPPDLETLIRLSQQQHLEMVTDMPRSDA